MCEYRTSCPRHGRTLVACRCFIATAFFGGINFFPFFMFRVFLFAFLYFSGSFEVPWVIVVGEVFGRCRVALVLLPPCASSTLVAAGLPDLFGNIPGFCSTTTTDNDDDHDPFRLSIGPAMSASTHRPSPRSTLPAFPVQRRSRSPPSGSVPSSSHLRRSLSPKGVRLPPIQSLDFAPRPAPREPLSSQSLGTPLQDHYPQ